MVWQTLHIDRRGQQKCLHPSDSFWTKIFPAPTFQDILTVHSNECKHTSKAVLPTANLTANTAVGIRKTTYAKHKHFFHVKADSTALYGCRLLLVAVPKGQIYSKPWQQNLGVLFFACHNAALHNDIINKSISLAISIVSASTSWLLFQQT